ncbi:hypothetical protein DSECCO2_464970 [anaerobic digester metagenome]
MRDDVGGNRSGELAARPLAVDDHCVGIPEKERTGQFLVPRPRASVRHDIMDRHHDWVATGQEGEKKSIPGGDAVEVEEVRRLALDGPEKLERAPEEEGVRDEGADHVPDVKSSDTDVRREGEPGWVEIERGEDDEVDPGGERTGELRDVLDQTAAGVVSEEDNLHLASASKRAR